MNREDILFSRIETDSLTIKSKKITIVNSKYENWIKEKFPTPKSARCQCWFASRQMGKEFPELTIHRGYYRSSKENSVKWKTKIEHWWCQTPNGEIIDPTGHQWEEDNRQGSYHELTDEEIKAYFPSGKCANCGFSVYDDNSFCSEDCKQEYEDYYGK